MAKSKAIKQVVWRDVHLALKDLPTYPEIMERFREHGGDKERWAPKDMVYMCHAITYTEDLDEIKHSRMNDMRRAMQTIRRKLEDCTDDLNYGMPNTRPIDWKVYDS